MRQFREERAEVFFASDIHFGSRGEDPHKQRRFEGLLAHIGAQKGALYLLGDLFDFGFPYRHVVPKAVLPVMAALDDLVQSGSPVYFLGGNHDFWMEPYIREETGLRVVPEDLVVEAQGRRICLLHGDGRGPGDTGYKILKRILRNRLAITLFRWIHPDVGVALGLKSSHVSRESSGEYVVNTESLFRHVALPRLQAGADAVLMGHHHVRHHQRADEGEFLILGDGFKEYSCARLKNGVVELMDWPAPAP